MIGGGYLTLLVGSTLPRPAPAELLRALRRVEVTVGESQPSAFQLTYQSGRQGHAGLRDNPLARSPHLQPLHRVIIVVKLQGFSHVLVDGVITDIQFTHGSEPGADVVTVTGEDLTVLMDLEEIQAEHPGQNALVEVVTTLRKYARYGIVPQVSPPSGMQTPSPVDRIPVQRETDLQLIQRLARQHGHVFYLAPGPVPGTNQAHWGPRSRGGLPQPALTWNMGTATNLESIDFQYDTLAATPVEGYVQDAETGEVHYVQSGRRKGLPLFKQSAMERNRKRGRRMLMTTSGLTHAQARRRAQSRADGSEESAVIGRGKLNSLAYGHILKARQRVGLRGVGQTYDGLYQVNQVTHSIEPGHYTQSFKISRGGTGSTTPMVRI